MILEHLLRFDLAALLFDLFVSLPVIVLAVTVHEFAHAWTASRLGDPTARALGRVTLNPLAHLDPAGSILFLIAGFGWGKPVPFDPRHLRRPKQGMLLIAAAGPASNIALALLSALVWNALPHPALPEGWVAVIWAAVGALIHLNVLLAVFNLLPLPPLDGSRILMGILPDRLARGMAAIEGVAWPIVAILAITGGLGRVIEPVYRLVAGWVLLLVRMA